MQQASSTTGAARGRRGSVSKSHKPQVLVGHVLAFIAEDVPPLEAEPFRRLIAPALAAADVDRSGVLDREEVGALVRAIVGPRASEKTVAKAWYDIQVAANSDTVEGVEDTVVNVADATGVAEALRHGTLRQTVCKSSLVLRSPLFATDGVLERGPARRTLLQAVGSVALEHVEEEWTAVAQQVKAAATNAKVRQHVRTALSERIAAFEDLLVHTRLALTRPGGGDERVVATASFALEMVQAEARRALGVSEFASKRGK